MKPFLAGKKTYVTAALGILGAVAGVCTGEASLAQAFQAVLTAVSAATIRHGIANK